MMTKDEAERLAREAFYDGRVIEAGWISSVLLAAPDDIDPDELFQIKCAFFSGVRYMLTLMLNPPGRTKAEKAKIMAVIMKNMHCELADFGREIMDDAPSINLH